MLLLFHVFCIDLDFLKKTVTLNDVNQFDITPPCKVCDCNNFTFRDCRSKTELFESFCTILLFFVMIALLWNTPPSHFVIKIVLFCNTCPAL